MADDVATYTEAVIERDRWLVLWKAAVAIRDVEAACLAYRTWARWDREITAREATPDP